MRTRIAVVIVASAAIAATTAFAHGFGGGYGHGPGGMGCGMGYGAGQVAAGCDGAPAAGAQHEKMRSEMLELRRLASTEGTGSAAYEAQARKVEALRSEWRGACRRRLLPRNDDASDQ